MRCLSLLVVLLAAAAAVGVSAVRLGEVEIKGCAWIETCGRCVDKVGCGWCATSARCEPGTQEASSLVGSKCHGDTWHATTCPRAADELNLPKPLHYRRDFAKVLSPEDVTAQVSDLVAHLHSDHKSQHEFHKDKAANSTSKAGKNGKAGDKKKKEKEGKKGKEGFHHIPDTHEVNEAHYNASKAAVKAEEIAAELREAQRKALLAKQHEELVAVQALQNKSAGGNGTAAQNGTNSTQVANVQTAQLAKAMAEEGKQEEQHLEKLLNQTKSDVKQDEDVAKKAQEGAGIVVCKKDDKKCLEAEAKKKKEAEEEAKKKKTTTTTTNTTATAKK